MDVDLFGEPFAVRKRRPAHHRKVELFDVESDLSLGERQVVASRMVDLSRRYDREDYKRAASLRLESIRYAACNQSSLTLQCDRDYTRYFVRLFCHSRICERCARIYVKELRRSIVSVAKSTAANRHRGYTLALLTLTVTSKRYGDQLPDREGIVRLYRESSEFLRRFYGKYANQKTRSGKWRENRKRYIGAGWLATIEVGKENNNLHVHALVYGPIRSQSVLKEAWANITGDSFGVDVRRKSPGEAVNYVLKYIAKPPATDSYQRIAEYADMIKKSRRLRSGGIFYNRFKLQKRERSSLICPVCGSKLRLIEQLQSVPGDGYYDLRAIQRGEKDINFGALADNLNFLPGDVIPVGLPL